jgi:hypothetical protein
MLDPRFQFRQVRLAQHRLLPCIVRLHARNSETGNKQQQGKQCAARKRNAGADKALPQRCRRIDIRGRVRRSRLTRPQHGHCLIQHVGSVGKFAYRPWLWPGLRPCRYCLPASEVFGSLAFCCTSAAAPLAGAPPGAVVVAEPAEGVVVVAVVSSVLLPQPAVSRTAAATTDPLIRHSFRICI